MQVLLLTICISNFIICFEVCAARRSCIRSELLAIGLKNDRSVKLLPTIKLAAMYSVIDFRIQRSNLDGGKKSQISDSD